MLCEVQEHYDEFILQKNPKPVSKELKGKFDMGNKNEIHGITAILVPALLPPCMQVVEDGCSFLHGDIIPILLEVSTDGYIECQKGYHCRDCNTNAPFGHYRCTIEIKYITDDMKIAYRYNIPIYHATQMICQMHVKKVIEGWYVLVSERMVILITLKYNKKIWKKCGKQSKNSLML